MTAAAVPFTATLAGAFGLVRGDDVALTPRGSRARALLGYLMLSQSGSVTRERIAALLWSDRGEDQARASLRQVLFELRTLSGAGGLVLVTRTDIRLVGAALSTDLDAFVSAAAADDLAALVRLYGDPPRRLLEDIDDISPAFDDWLAGQRERTREERRALALAACERVLARSDARDAYRLARIVAADDPLDETAAIVAMTAAHASGDVAATRRLFAALETALRGDLGVGPSPNTRMAFDRLMHKPPHPAATPPATALPTPAPPESTDRRVPLWRRRPRAIGVAAIIAVAGVPAVMLLRADGKRDAQHLVLVSPLTSPRDDRAARALSAGLSTALAHDLVGTGTPVQIVEGVSSPEVQPALVLASTAITSDGQVHASVKLTTGVERSVVWSSDFSRPAREVDQMIEQIGLQVAREIHCAYANGRAPLVASDPEAARLSLAACDAVGRDFDESARYAAQVVARAPGFARGWSEYAAAVSMAAVSLPPGARAIAGVRATRYAQRAIALDPRQGLAYFAIASTKQGIGQWSARDAVVAQGLRADPDNGELNAMRAQDLTEIGRLQDAIGFIRHSFALDHFLPGKLRQMASLEADLGDLDQANAMLAQGETLWPHHPWFDDLALKIAYHWGDPREATRLLALKAAAKGLPRRAADDAFIAWRTAPSPATNAAAAATAIAAAAAETGPTVDLVEQLAALGRNDDAFALAARLSGSVDGRGSWFRDYLAPFRADRRFMTLAKRIGLAAIWRRTGLWPDFCSDRTLPYDCKIEAARRS